jgi:anti-sigma-K factor RskA
MTDVEEHGGGERDDDVVAAEYVLGVLPDAERADAARRVGTDRVFAMQVAAWEERLSGLNEAFGEAEAPARVWREVENRLFASTETAGSPVRAGLIQSLVFWRGLSFAALAAVAVLATVILTETPATPPREELVASLSAADSEAAFLAVKAADGSVRVTRTGIEPPSGRSHELWVIVADRDPISLGLVTPQGTTSTVLPADIARMPDDALTLAVTLEPEGGAPQGKPTGPVVAAGQLKKI